MGIAIFLIILGYFCITCHKWDGAMWRVKMMATQDEMPDPDRSWFLTISGILCVILGVLIIIGILTGYLSDN